MKYTIDYSQYFGFNYDVYDSETLTKTTVSGCGDYKTTREKSLTVEEMREFAQKQYTNTLKSMYRDLQKLQEKYDEELKKIQDFEKSLLTK